MLNAKISRKTFRMQRQQVTWSAHEKPMQNYTMFRSPACTATLAQNFCFYFILREGVPPLFYLLPDRISRPKNQKLCHKPQSPNRLEIKAKSKNTTTCHNHTPYHRITIGPTQVKISTSVEIYHPHTLYRLHYF